MVVNVHAMCQCLSLSKARLGQVSPGLLERTWCIELPGTCIYILIHRYNGLYNGRIVLSSYILGSLFKISLSINIRFFLTSLCLTISRTKDLRLQHHMSKVSVFFWWILYNINLLILKISPCFTNNDPQVTKSV